ncbi:MAG TPA: DNA-binding protein [Myxococcota bacterium]|nr:DNA-binding protein [Myxococcota bacterium]
MRTLPLVLLLGCARPPGSPVAAYALRLHPGDDLKDSLVAWSQGVGAATVLSCVGSLSAASLRLADQPEPVTLDGPFEIVSLVGTLSPDGAHLHLAVADAEGHALGGHLTSGSPVYTTAEVVLGVLPALRFSREVDPETTYRELVVEPAGGRR